MAETKRQMGAVRDLSRDDGNFEVKVRPRDRLAPPDSRSTYNAESTLSRLVSPHFSRAQHEARSLHHEVFRSAGDLEIQGDDLHVRINALSCPRRTRALAAMCKELNTTKTIYPGTDLTLVYSVNA